MKKRLTLANEVLNSTTAAAPAAADKIYIMYVEKINSCPDCESTYVNAGSLKTHMMKVHGYETIEFQCHVCQNTFDQATKLTRHKKLHVQQ